jgi:hypothetical protein
MPERPEWRREADVRLAHPLCQLRPETAIKEIMNFGYIRAIR